MLFIQYVIYLKIYIIKCCCRITNKGTKLGLDILECCVADAGQYALIVTNKKGESKAAFSLNI